jgi:hypothetical protein
MEIVRTSESCLGNVLLLVVLVAAAKVALYVRASVMMRRMRMRLNFFNNYSKLHPIKKVVQLIYRTMEFIFYNFSTEQSHHDATRLPFRILKGNSMNRSAYD